jgi:hypothetical protein
VDQEGRVLARRKSARKRGQRSSNPHGVRREKIAAAAEDAAAADADADPLTGAAEQTPSPNPPANTEKEDLKSRV